MKDIHLGVAQYVSGFGVGVVVDIDVVSADAATAVLRDILMSVDEKMGAVWNHAWVNGDGTSSDGAGAGSSRSA